MTIDERIEALTARHEALTQSVELLGSFHHDTDAAIQKLTENMEALDRKLTAQIAENADNISLISRLVLIHDKRLKDLESNAN